MAVDHPSGTVTFLFTDIEGSTKLAQQYPDRWEALRARHHAILQSAMDAHNGYVFQIIGDAFCVAFPTAGEALRAALRSQKDLLAEKWGEAVIKVRMGIHTGKAEVQPDGQYQGYLSMSRVQRVMSVAYGGQVLISNSSAELLRSELPEGSSLLDMKEHRLKGLLNPEHLWQAASTDLPGDFPPLQSLNSIPNNLPIQLTSFIGREKEIAELKQALNDHRLVTLTGSGGTGKSRLSLQVAAEVIDAFPQGVWFLELAPVSDPALVPNILASLIGLRESAETKQSISELNCSYFQFRKALLVFDNCEHLIEACARFADLLLRSCKDVKILATSREALGVEGEIAWRVPSLSLPDLNHLPAIGQLSQYEAVRLFIERSTLIQPQFAMTKENAPALAQVCFRLDGIPLAIELAAARSNVLTVEQIVKRLDDRFRLLTGGARTALPRQQTLRAMIDWSYNLLSDEESLLFRRLAVFTGGCTLEAAEAVCSGEGIKSDLVLDLLSQLVKKSLVIMTEEYGESRYSTLETIHQYGREKMIDSVDVETLRNRHLAFYLKLAEEAEPRLYGPSQLVWLHRLGIDHDNLLAALEWTQNGGEANAGLRMAIALWWFWNLLSLLREGYEWFERTLEKCKGVSGTEAVRAKALYRVVHLALYLGTDYAQPNNILLQESLELNRKLADKVGCVYSLLFLAWTANEPHAAKVFYEEALALARQAGDVWLISAILLNIGDSHADQGNHIQAIVYLDESLSQFRKLGDRWGIAWSLLGLAQAYSLQQNYDQVASLLEESLVLFRELGYKVGVGKVLFAQGNSAFSQGDYAQARVFFEENLALARDMGIKYKIATGLFYLGFTLHYLGEYQLAVTLMSESLLSIREQGIVGQIPVCLVGLAGVHLVLEHAKQAVRLLAAAEALCERTNSPLTEQVHIKYNKLVVQLRGMLERPEFETLWAEGRDMTMEQAVALALEVKQ